MGRAAGTTGDAAGTACAIVRAGEQQPSATRLAAAAIGVSGPGGTGRVSAAPVAVAAAAMSTCAVAAGRSRRVRGTQNPEARAGRDRPTPGASAGTEPQEAGSDGSEAGTSGSEGDGNSGDEGGRDEKGGVSESAAALDQVERRRGQGKGGRAPGVTQAETGRGQGGGVSLDTTASIASQFSWQQARGHPRQAVQFQ